MEACSSVAVVVLCRRACTVSDWPRAEETPSPEDLYHACSTSTETANGSGRVGVGIQARCRLSPDLLGPFRKGFDLRARPTSQGRPRQCTSHLLENHAQDRLIVHYFCGCCSNRPRDDLTDCPRGGDFCRRRIRLTWGRATWHWKLRYQLSTGKRADARSGQGEPIRQEFTPVKLADGRPQ